MSALPEHDSFMANDDYARLMAWRWPNGRPECPRCGHGEFYVITTRRQFNCKACRHQFSVTSGTILSNIKAPVSTVVAAIEAVMADPEIAAAEVMRRTGMSYKGAHYLVGRLKSQVGGG